MFQFNTKLLYRTGCYSLGTSSSIINIFCYLYFTYQYYNPPSRVSATVASLNGGQPSTRDKLQCTSCANTSDLCSLSLIVRWENYPTQPERDRRAVGVTPSNTDGSPISLFLSLNLLAEAMA